MNSGPACAVNFFPIHKAVRSCKMPFFYHNVTVLDPDLPKVRSYVQTLYKLNI
jgi:hypothetical protein